MKPEDIGNERDLANYRLEEAKELLVVAKENFAAGHYKSANNRAYYAVFHAINAVFALERVAFKRHKDALGHFNKEYVRTEKFSKELGKRIGKVQDVRHASDYDDFYIASKMETGEQIATAEELIDQVETFIQSHNGAAREPMG